MAILKANTEENIDKKRWKIHSCVFDFSKSYFLTYAGHYDEETACPFSNWIELLRLRNMINII